jgi:hypothetical protein
MSAAPTLSLRDLVSNPWCDPPPGSFTVETSSRRKRRAFHSVCPPTATASGEAADATGPKRAMRPAISEMSVRDERKALQEIRAMESAKVSDRLKCNDMLVGEFALRYTLGHHCKRRMKHRVKDADS